LVSAQKMEIFDNGVRMYSYPLFSLRGKWLFIINEELVKLVAIKSDKYDLNSVVEVEIVTRRYGKIAAGHRRWEDNMAILRILGQRGIPVIFKMMQVGW
jgi:hypothetical protein